MSVTELRAWIVGRGDGGADLFAEASCPIPSEAVVVANEARREIALLNTGFVQTATKHVFDGAEVTTDDTLAKLKVPATREQLDALVAIVEEMFKGHFP